MPTLPPLNALRVFTVAARLGSFKQAAEELYVTPGAVSRQIQNLETYLGAKLFERRYREVSLTKVGELYLSQIGPALFSIDQTSLNIKRLTQPAIVRVESTPTFAMYWLIPRLREFQKINPEIEVVLTTAQGNLDTSKEIDVFIRRDPKQFSGLKGQRFMTEWSTLVCCPEYAKSNSCGTVEGILDLQLICMKSRPDLWRKWLDKYMKGAKQPTRFFEFDNTILAIQAAIEGLGIALIPSLFLGDLLQGKSLVEMPGSQSIPTGYYHILRPAEEKTEGVKAFTDWLASCGSGPQDVNLFVDAGRSG